MATPVHLVDEKGLKWSTAPSDIPYKRLKLTKLQAEDLACWRDQMVEGFAKKGHQDVALERLNRVTEECLAATSSNDELIERLVHAAKAYITLHVYASTDPGR